MPLSQDLEVLNNAIRKCGGSFEAGLENKLGEEEVTKVLSTLLWEITQNSRNGLIEVRDYDQIAQKGTFKYSGKADTMLKEGLMPEDVFTELKTLPGMKADDTRHIGPSYLRVKGLLTHQPSRTFFGRQMAYKIEDYLKEKPLSKQDGFVVCIPNMTGGAFIGDETRRQLETISKHNIWPATPYARETRKTIYLISPEEKLVDFIEGVVPTPENTSLICCFEELRTAAETTQNATYVYRNFGYDEINNNARIAETCVFDYGHPVGVERLRRLGVDRLYLVDGKEFLETSKEQGYISDSQRQTAKDWLTDPWKFTREVIPVVKKIAIR